MQRKPKILGRLLVEEGGLSAQAVDAGLEEQKRSGRRLGEVLIELGLAEPETVPRSLATETGTRLRPWAGRSRGAAA